MSNVALYQSDFNGGSTGLAVTLDAFGDTDTRYVRADRIDLGGSRGGVLSLLLGGVDNADVRDISGGWERSFSLASDAQVTLSFSYNLTQAANYESNEFSEVLVSLDGVLFGRGGNDYVARISGNGNGGSERSTGWVTVELDLGLQEAGNHVLALGGFNNQKTYNDESTQVLFDDVSLTATTFTPSDVQLISADFEGNADGFSYRDDAFGTNNPGYASGATIDVGGDRGGVLSLDLGGVDDSTVVDMSGGWEKTFTLADAADTKITFRYNLTQDAGYESDEYSEVVVAVDGVLVGTGNHDYVVRLTGDGNGGSDQTTGWVTVELDLGTVSAGTHTLTIGGFNNKKTLSTESSRLLIDDVSVTTSVAIAHTTDLLHASFDNGTDGFGYRDDVFGTSRPSYADGTTIDIGGDRGGVLALQIGGVDNADITNMSGGWQQTFSVDETTGAKLSFLFNMTQTAQYESNEYSEVRVAIDGKLVGTNGHSYVARLIGDGNGGSDKTTGWQIAELDLGDLGPGKHTLTIGGFNNKKTYHDESTEILIDDVQVTKGTASSSGTEPLPDPEPTTDPTSSDFVAASFSSTTDGFTYKDDVYGGSHGAYESGARINLGGSRGGVLAIELGGVDDSDVTNMSGGWEKSFAVDSQTDAKVTFSYNMTQSSEYESNEYSELRVSIDGKSISLDGHDYVARLVGDGNGGSDKTTGWQTVELDLGKLDAGTHSLTIGGFNNQKTLANESTEVLIDDVSVSAGQASTNSGPSDGTSGSTGSTSGSTGSTSGSTGSTSGSTGGTTVEDGVFTGHIIQAASGRPSDLQAAINKASAGDIVKIPAGTWTFNGEVTAPDGIHIMGAGRDKTILHKTSTSDNAMITVNVENHEAFKFSGITLEGASGSTVRDTGLALRGGLTDFEIFDSRFMELGQAGISISGTQGPNHGTPTGVIYNNEFIDNFYPERGYGVAVGGDEDTDSQPLQLGTDYAVIIEDNYFENNRHAVASNNSSRYVFRYNTIEGGQDNSTGVDAHGLKAWPEGSKSYEVYGNELHGGDGMWAGIGIRGGDGVIYDNHISSYNKPIVLMIEDYSSSMTYPVQDQIRDLWIWDNTFNGKTINDVSFMDSQANASKLIVEGRDYYFNDKPGYSPFAYPHPLRDDTVQHSTNGDDVLRGDMTDDILIGLNGNDDLKGLGGDDVLVGGPGKDVMSGGSGKDAFLYMAGDQGSGVDVISDFDSGRGGDILDLSDMLSGYGNNSNASDFVRLSSSGGDTKVQVDVNGPTNGSGFVDLVVLDGVTGLSVNTMLQDGNLILS